MSASGANLVGSGYFMVQNHVNKVIFLMGGAVHAFNNDKHGSCFIRRMFLCMIGEGGSILRFPLPLCYCCMRKVIIMKNASFCCPCCRLHAAAVTAYDASLNHHTTHLKR